MAPTTKTSKKTIAKSDEDNPDLGEVFNETAERDAEEVKLGAAAKHVKQCHLLSKEAEGLLVCARRETSTNEIIDAELKRVMVLTVEMHAEAKEARKALKR